jgi:hypothetical protein
MFLVFTVSTSEQAHRITAADLRRLRLKGQELNCADCQVLSKGALYLCDVTQTRLKYLRGISNGFSEFITNRVLYPPIILL